MSAPAKICPPKLQRFVESVLENGGKIGGLYKEFGLSRSAAHRWWQRFLKGGQTALCPAKRGPRGGQGRRESWQAAVLALRRRYPTWGAEKLLVVLRREHAYARLPSERTIHRILLAAGRVRSRRRTAGPALPRPSLTVPKRSNEVWTADFKGDFCTGDGTRCRALTVRDAYSRFILAIEHLRVTSDRATRRVLRRCFRRYGLPRVIRVDNGKPFGGEGARGLSSLSAWWTRLRIRVEFIRPGQPQDNGAHEQMHGVLKSETARPPAKTLRAQVDRLKRFRERYNQVRPHGSLGLQTPAEIYRPKPTILPKLVRLHYPKEWLSKRVSENGMIYWEGKQRMIGRAFRGEIIGFKPRPDAAHLEGLSAEVYFGELLLGHLYANDRGALRPVRFRGKYDSAK